jgi:UDP-glucose 4-epimerase
MSESGPTAIRPLFGCALVTGANGFLGRALVRRLVDAGVDTVCNGRRAIPNPPPGSRWIAGDVADPVFVDKLVGESQPDVVFHLAGEVTGSRSLEAVLPTVANNLTASINILRTVTDLGCRRIVLIGSGDEPDGATPPCSPYAAAKWAVGGYARMFERLYGTPFTIARPFMVYGPDQPDVNKIVPYTILSVRRGQAPVVTSGRRLCDWVYIDDVVDALLVVADAPACLGRRVDVGTGQLHTVRHVVESLCTMVDPDVRPVFGGMPDRRDETEAVADIEETYKLCGWSPRTDLQSGLERTVDWYRHAPCSTRI